MIICQYNPRLLENQKNVQECYLGKHIFFYKTFRTVNWKKQNILQRIDMILKNETQYQVCYITVYFSSHCFIFLLQLLFRS